MGFPYKQTPSPARGRQRALGTQWPGGGGAARIRRRRRTRRPASALAGVDVSPWRRVSARRGRRERGRAGAQGLEPPGWRAGWGCEASGALGLAWPGKTSQRLAPPRSPPCPLSRLGRAGCPGRPGPQQASPARLGAAGKALGPAGSPGSPDASAKPGRGPAGEALIVWRAHPRGEPPFARFNKYLRPLGAASVCSAGSELTRSDLRVLIAAAEGRTRSLRGRGPLALKTNLLFALTLHTTHPFKTHR